MIVLKIPLKPQCLVEKAYHVVTEDEDCEVLLYIVNFLRLSQCTATSPAVEVCKSSCCF